MHVMLGKLPHHVDYISWCLTGLGIMLAQVTYNVHIWMNRIKIYGNMNRWDCRGNLHFTIEEWQCCCSVAEHCQRCPGCDSWRMPTSSLSSFFCLITSKFIYFQHEAKCSEELLFVWYETHSVDVPGEF